jgi:N-hydroxyarylamine O-acetyltransferase
LLDGHDGIVLTQRRRLSEWGTDLVDLDAYLHRLGLVGPLDPSARTLRLLHRAHLTAITFENLDAAMRRGIPLDLESVQDKLVRRARGGYCHEHNLLFGAVLERLGFHVRRVLARICLEDGHILPRGHAALLVGVDDQTWLADVGYGGHGPLQPLPLITGRVIHGGGWRHRLIQRGNEWTLQTDRAGRWVNLYAIGETDFRQADFEMANYFTATHSSSPFATSVIVQRLAEDVRYALHGLELVIDRPTGETHRLLIQRDQLARVLACTFGIALSTDEVDQLLSLL